MLTVWSKRALGDKPGHPFCRDNYRVIVESGSALLQCVPKRCEWKCLLPHAHLLSRSVMSDYLRPHDRKPTRLLRPRDSPGKNTGLGYYFHLQRIFPIQNPGTEPRDPGDPGLIPGLGRSPGEGNGNPLQYSCPKNSMDRGAWLQPMGSQRVGHDWMTNTK